MIHDICYILCIYIKYVYDNIHNTFYGFHGFTVSNVSIGFHVMYHH